MRSCVDSLGVTAAGGLACGSAIAGKTIVSAANIAARMLDIRCIATSRIALLSKRRNKNRVQRDLAHQPYSGNRDSAHQACGKISALTAPNRKQRNRPHIYVN